MKVEEFKAYYEVWRITPMGDFLMGRFKMKQNADECVEKWNKTIKNEMDKAEVIRVEFND